jgi:hypothetical protein
MEALDPIKSKTIAANITLTYFKYLLTSIKKQSGISISRISRKNLLNLVIIFEKLLPK